MGQIKLLSDDIINKIAAGEVVERPASVVKELVENALDAGATQVTVEIREGGRASISVADDGGGIAPEDALLAVQRHATSKIARVDDLFAIQTMGFRGEALASIAAVSRFTLTSRTADQGEGFALGNGSGAWATTPRPRPRGTTVMVDDLFHNVPARKSFLKAAATEAAAILELMQALAIARLDVGFTLRHNQKEILHAPLDAEAAGDRESAFRRRVRALFGDGVADGLLYVTREHDAAAVEALVSPPGVEKNTGKYVHLFVNGRCVKDKNLRFAVMRGYHSHLLKGKHPVAFLKLTVDPTLVDVNVHPAKTELRFQYVNDVQNAVATAIRDVIRQGAWAKPEAAGANRDDARDDEEDVGADPAASARIASRFAARDHADAGHDAPGLPSRRAGHEPARPLPDQPAFPPRAASSFPPRPAATPSRDADASCFSQRAARVAPGPSPAQRGASVTAPLPRAPEWRAPAASASDGEPRDAAGVDPARGAVTDDAPSFRARDGEAGGADVGRARDARIPSAAPLAAFWDPAPAFPEAAATSATIPWAELTYLGTFARLYLFFTHGDRFLAVDQHAFHERILFEAFYRDPAILETRQTLLMPEVLRMAPGLVANLAEREAELRRLGFDYAVMDERHVELRAVPLLLAKRDGEELLTALADPDAQHGSGAADARHGVFTPLLATMACHAAVRKGEELSLDEIARLVKEAEGVDFYHNCPHGRPVFKWWREADVARWFER